MYANFCFGTPVLCMRAWACVALSDWRVNNYCQDSTRKSLGPVVYRKRVPRVGKQFAGSPGYRYKTRFEFRTYSTDDENDLRQSFGKVVSYEKESRVQELNRRGRENSRESAMTTAFITCHYCIKPGHKGRDCKRKLKREYEMIEKSGKSNH